MNLSQKPEFRQQLLDHFFFLKTLFQSQNSYKELIWCPTTQMSIFKLFVSAGVLSLKRLNLLSNTDKAKKSMQNSMGHMKVL